MIFLPGSHIYLSLCKFWGFHRGVAGDSILLGHDIALLGSQFLKNFVKMWCLQNIRNQTPSDMASQKKNGILFPMFILDKYLCWPATESLLSSLWYTQSLPTN